MRRTVTAAVLAGWIGFLFVSGLTAVLAMLQAAGLQPAAVPGLSGVVGQTADMLLARGDAEILATTVAAIMQFMVAAFLALALWLLRGHSAQDHAVAEKLAIVGLGCAGLLVLAMHLCGFALFERFGTLAGIETVVALSIAAVLFDRMIVVAGEDDPSDEADFHAAITLIGQQLARDAASRGAPDDDAGERRIRS